MVKVLLARNKDGSITFEQDSQTLYTLQKQPKHYVLVQGGNGPVIATWDKSRVSLAEQSEVRISDLLLRKSVLSS